MSSERAIARPNARAAILDAAFCLLADGVGAPLTLDEVAKAAGVSRQAIYLHFEGRNQLLLAVADRARGTEAVARLISGISLATTPRTALTMFARTIGAMHRRSALAHLAVEALCRTDRDLAALWARRPAGRAKKAREVTDRMRRSGVLALPPQRATDLLHALTGPGLFDQLVTRAGWSHVTYEAHLARVLLAALVLPGREDDALVVPHPTETREDNDGTDSRRRGSARDHGSRVEPRRRQRLRRSLHR